MKTIEGWAVKELVKKFVDNPIWPREMKISKRLLSEYSSDLDAWLSLNIGKLPSLAFFLKDENRIFVPQSQKNPYLLDLDKLRSKSKKSIDFIVD